MPAPAAPPHPPAGPAAPAPIDHAHLDLSPERDGRAWREWSAHLAAGRIGATPPSQPTSPPPREMRLASLAAILARTASAHTGRPA